jgi:glycyl-tRNA synthetase beta chain
MSEFLLEVRAEEIPARMLPGAIRELATRTFEELMARGVAPAEVEATFTPRRLILILHGMPEREKDRVEESYGPPLQAAWKNGAWTPAAAGFAKKVGATDTSALSLFKGKPGKEIRERKALVDGDVAGLAAAPDWYLGFSREVPGRSVQEVLSQLLPELLRALSWGKTMKWCTNDGPWVRPVHGIVALLDSVVVPFELFGVAAGRSTVGHAILSPAPFDVSSVADYRAQLQARNVVISFDERRKSLWEGIASRALAAGATAVEDAELLDKLASICEIPGVMEGALSDDLLRLPREVLQTSLRDHQSALTAEKDGALAPIFLTVMDRPDDPKGRVRAGNEWVVAARLADAKFFYSEDRKAPLADRAERLGSLTFHEKLGSYREKKIRVGKVAEALVRELTHSDSGASREAALSAHVARAVDLAKLDLTTEMVREFTSLQGIMGGVYAREDGEPEPVWQAVYDQYLPASADDALPRGEAGAILGIVDRLDTLVGFFGLGSVPTGSKDPFGLRRAAQGLVRIALEQRLDSDLFVYIDDAYGSYGGKLPKPLLEVRGQLEAFLLERVRYLLGLQGLSFDEIEAALGHRTAVATGRRLHDYQERARAFQKLRVEPWLAELQKAAKRIENITKDVAGGVAIAEESVGVPAEDALRSGALRLLPAVNAAASSGDYGAALAALEPLSSLLESFFKDVLVMDPDPAVSGRRLKLLRTLDELLLSRVGRLTALAL